MTIAAAFALFVKFFFLLTPPFVISVFLAVTKDSTVQERRTLAIWISLWVLIISGVLLFFGGFIFNIFGITLDAFRIGTGAVLFLTAVSLVKGDSVHVPSSTSVQSLAVVPMAIPITLGPASIGALMVYGGEIKTGFGFFIAYVAIAVAVACVGVLLLLSSYIQKAVGKNGLVVLSKLTGLILAALSAQMMFEGIGAFITQAVKRAIGS